VISTLTFNTEFSLRDVHGVVASRGVAGRAAPRALDHMHHLGMASLRQIHGVRT